MPETEASRVEVPGPRLKAGAEFIVSAASKDLGQLIRGALQGRLNYRNARSRERGVVYVGFVSKSLLERREDLLGRPITSAIVTSSVFSMLLKASKEGNWLPFLEDRSLQLRLIVMPPVSQVAQRHESWYVRTETGFSPVNQEEAIRQIPQRLQRNEFLLEIFPDRATLQGASPAYPGSKAVAAIGEIAREFSSRRDQAAQDLQSRLRELGTVKPSTLSEGQTIARTINNLLMQHGCCFCFAGTQSPAKLAYLGTRTTEPGGFCLTGVKAKKRTTEILSAAGQGGETIRDNFSLIEVMPAPPRRPRTKRK